MRLSFWNKPIAVRPAWDIDVLVWVGGDPERTRGALGRTLASLRAELPEAFVSFLIDGPEWERPLAEWRPWFPGRRELRLTDAAELPALLYGMAIAGSAHPWVAFLWAGCGVSGEGMRRLRAAALPGDELVYGDPLPPVPAELSHPVQPGWLEMADLVPMHHCLLARQVGEILRCDDSPGMQRSFWRDLTLRLSREGSLRHVPAAAPPRLWGWESFPFRRDFAEAKEGALRVVLLSGLLDAHQNQLFFYNYSQLAGGEVLDLRTVLYERCRPEDLAGCDLAVFSRPRFPAVPALLDLCRTAGIPTLVMIDDNWIAAGREFPRFERLFTPGKPAFEVFLEALRRADAVLVFNPVLAEEVKPWARRVVQLPPNVDVTLFPARERPPGKPFLAGFAGSPRFEEAGFRALAGFLGGHPEARLLVMAHEVPEPLREVPAGRLTFLPWRHDYAAYARDLAAHRPDVLLAPLDASRFSASKIPIKFLEAAAVGAAGIYSRVPPYTGHVRDGETGLLVENREDAWAAALERLVGDPELRRRIARNAAAEVAERFATPRLLPDFLAMLRSVIAG
jgi:glycosyltransferase involved in cell wall biosynthesis